MDTQPILSLSLSEAVDQNLLLLGENVQMASTVRIVPNEDNGQCFGPIQIGDGAIVSDYVILCSGVRLGSNARIGVSVVVRKNVSIGDDSILSHHVNIERDCTIGDRVRISGQSHITGDCFIGDDVQIGAMVVTVNDRDLLWRRGAHMKPPIFHHGCRVGSGTTVGSGVQIGQNALVGMGSVVTRDVPPNMIAYGNPARLKGERGTTRGPEIGNMN